jgi:hypothetical protein
MIALFARARSWRPPKPTSSRFRTTPCTLSSRIEPTWRIPVLNMLDETMPPVGNRYPGHTVGLLATAGTVEAASTAAAERARVPLIVPDAGHQARVTQAIYGRWCQSGGYEGTCRKDLLAAVRHLAHRGATIAIFGCTELPTGRSRCSTPTTRSNGPLAGRRCRENARHPKQDMPHFNSSLHGDMQYGALGGKRIHRQPRRLHVRVFLSGTRRARRWHRASSIAIGGQSARRALPRAPASRCAWSYFFENGECSRRFACLRHAAWPDRSCGRR